MKLFTSVIATAAALTVAASAQSVATKAKLESVIILKDGKPKKSFIYEASATNISFVDNARATSGDKLPLSEVKSVYMLEPKAFTASVELFEDRKYNQAQQRFAEIREKYQGVSSLSGNYATLAGFYELESMRKQLRVKQLVEAVANFDAAALTNAGMIQQVEVYKFWELLQNKDWARLDSLAKRWAKKKLPVSIQAQVEYCHGKALEGLARQNDALNAYARATVVDFTKSEEICRDAVYSALNIYSKSPEVKQAKSDWGLEAENKNGKGYKMLVEANALARLYDTLGLGAGVALPAKYAMFLDYNPKKAK